jgi:hypothetical protein
MEITLRPATGSVAEDGFTDTELAHLQDELDATEVQMARLGGRNSWITTAACTGG